MTHDDTAEHEPDERDWRLERNEKADGGHATVLSPSALNRFLGCEFRTHLDILERRGELDAERRPPNMSFLFDRGERHEEQVVARLEEDGLDVIDLTLPGAKAAERAAATVDALRNGHDVIVQGCFDNGRWVGYPDFLVRVATPSDLGDFSYEVKDAKLTRNAKPSHIHQLLFYTDELERLQGLRPQRMHLFLGSGEEPAYTPADFEAYAVGIRDEFVARFGELMKRGDPAYPYPVAACGFCHWWHVCRDKRRADDHLSLTANLTRAQGLKLEQSGVHRVTDLAAVPDDVMVPRLQRETLDNLRAQARLQVASRGKPVPEIELLEPAHDRGLSRLPAPSAGDVHFDFEGDPNWGDEGLEYLWGTLYDAEDGVRYEPRWATSRAAERAALEDWIDWLTERLERHPDLHVYHYNSYEPVALKRLVARHATREEELDDLLRRKVFVDLYGITRQTLRAGVESYGLKPMEAVFGFQRRQDETAIGSLRRWQAYLEDGNAEWLEEIAVYNEDDVRSTAALQDWLWALRPQVEAAFDVELAALAPEPPSELSDRQLLRQQRLEELRATLTVGLPDSEADDTEDDRARRLAFLLSGYHAREAKPGWWALFARRERTMEQLRDEDPEALGDLTLIETDDVGKSWEWRMAFPAQEFKLSPGGVDDPLAECGAQIMEIDEAARTVVVRRGKGKGDTPPLALAPGGPYACDAQEDALFEWAQRLAENGLGQRDAGTDLLLGRAPRLNAGTPPLTSGAVDLDRLVQQVDGLDESTLTVQGPPGSGKTYTGARLAVRLMDLGRRVGVVATSHKAINNLLEAVDDAADELGIEFRGWRKDTDGDNRYESDRIVCTKALDESDGPVLLRAGTAWYWAREEARQSVDVLLVDEAGQVSLADAIAIVQGTRSVVLLGDPQQLAHVSQGTHALASGASVLEHMLAGEHTIPPDRGVLLDVSWRMHPDVCDFVSRTMYDGRLTSEPGCAHQRIVSPGALEGTGLRMLHPEHEDNRTRSEEEAAAVADGVQGLLGGGRFIDRDGDERELSLEDILVVSPYNAQVRCLKAALPEGARVGTVDKFQGQEAPIVFFSMAASSGEDVSRGLGFLFSRNRLNVAISRAQALAVIVCSPRLFTARCATVEDMRLVNMLCQAREVCGT
ncbi:MAG: TM0106 family RecB-like putative nuclease [Baekduia sp.]